MTLFVVASGNTYPTTGSTNNLAAGQFGIFRPDYTPATAGNIAAAAYVYFAQGRIESAPNANAQSGNNGSMLGSKRSDKIYAANVLQWYKITAHQTATVQVTQVSNFNVECGQTVSLTLRLFSSYINVGFFNGLTRTVTVVAPCCACGTDPCTELDPTAMVDAFVAGVNTDPFLSQFVVANRTGTGLSSVLNLTGIPLNSYGQRCDPSAFPYEYDRMDFYTFVYLGAPTSVDYIVYDPCDIVATATVVQRATYPRGTSDEIAQMEKNYYSYQTFTKHLFEWDIFNNGFASYVVPGTFYDTYYLKFKEPLGPNGGGWDSASAQTYDVTVAVPTGDTAFTNIINVFLGTPTDESGSNFTTTTTTTTSTTSTSTTTTLFP